MCIAICKDFNGILAHAQNKNKQYGECAWCLKYNTKKNKRNTYCALR